MKCLPNLSQSTASLKRRTSYTALKNHTTITSSTFDVADYGLLIELLDRLHNMICETLNRAR